MENQANNVKILIFPRKKSERVDSSNYIVKGCAESLLSWRDALRKLHSVEFLAKAVKRSMIANRRRWHAKRDGWVDELCAAGGG